MPRGPFGMHIEVVRDDGAFEARNERVIVLKTVGQMGEEKVFYSYANGWPEEFQPGDKYDMIKRVEEE